MEYRILACEIILRAMKDLVEYDRTKDEYKDAVEFFNSKWYRDLAELAGMHPDYAIRLLKKLAVFGRDWQ